MTYSGTVRNGVVVLDGEARLPEGTNVEVCPTPSKGEPPLPNEEDFDLSDMAKYAVDTGIPDLATNLDHYLYGHPKEVDDR